MAELKTQRNDGSVENFLNAIDDEQKRKDCYTVMKLMQQMTKSKPTMWGTSIVGFGSYHYKGKSGREGDWFIMGFSPRKQNLTLYLITGFERDAALMKKLGKCKTGKSCLYINTLDDIDLSVLKTLMKNSYEYMKTKHA